MWQSLGEAILTGWLFVQLLLTGVATLPPPELPHDSEAAEIVRETAVVERVIDGDTIILNSGERVRLLGIDTPEREECYFEEAREYLAWWLDRAEVTLERDGLNTDEYGRLLRYVFVGRDPDGTGSSSAVFVNEYLVREGYARTMPIGEAKRYRAELAEWEEAARTAGAGRWSACYSAS